MNNEFLNNTIKPLTIGEQLRQARENMKLSQQAVAELLFLKISTVQNMEEDFIDPNLASTFLRGYIRSYAKLVNIPEEELVLMMAEKTLNTIYEIAPLKSFSHGIANKKYDRWLMRFTWLIFAIIIGMTCIWWLQYYQDQKQIINNITNNTSAKLFQKSNAKSISPAKIADI